MAKKVTFINYDPDGIQKEVIKQDGIDPDDWHYHVDDLVGAGLKITLSANKARDGFCCTMMDKLEGSKNKDIIVTAWGSSIAKAFSRTYYFVWKAEAEGVTWTELHKAEGQQSQQTLKEYQEFMEWKRRKEKPQGTPTG